MRTGEVVGVAALVGVAVLLGIAVTDDGSPKVVTADTSPFVFDATSTTSTTATTATTTIPLAPTTTAPPTTTGTAPSSAPATSEITVTTSIPAVQRGAIALRVLNAGAPARAATYVTAVLRGAGFAPAPPANARVPVDATRVVFALGHELDAATVNEVVKARPENVVVGSVGDPNWAEYGRDLAVLVVLGPA